MLTGKLPFEGKTFLTVLEAVKQREPAPIETINPEVPLSVAAIVGDCLQKRADQRPTMKRAVAVLEAAHVSTPKHALAGKGLPSGGGIAIASGMGTELGATLPAAPAEISTAARLHATKVVRSSRGRSLVGLGLVLLAGSLVTLGGKGAKHEEGAVGAPSASAAREEDVTSSSSNPEAQRYFDEAMRSFREGTGQVSSLLLKAVESDSEFGGAYLRLWWLANTTNSRERAEEYRRRLAATESTLSPRDHALLDCLTDPERAPLNAYLARYGNDAMATVYRVARTFEVSLESGANYALAPLEPQVAEVEGALAVWPNLVPLMAWKTLLLHRASRLDDALASANHCIEMAPHAVDCLSMRAAIYDYRHECASAAHDLRMVREVQPESPTARLQLAAVLAGGGAAVEALRDVLGDHPVGLAPVSGHLDSESVVPFYLGDFAEVARLASSAQKSVSPSGSEEEHYRPAASVVLADTEAGDAAGAAGVAFDYLSRRIAWADPRAQDVGVMVGAARRGGLITEEDADRRLEEAFQELLKTGAIAANAWAATYASSAETKTEAVEAVKKLDAVSSDLPTAWRGTLARVLFLAHRQVSAQPLLEQLTSRCTDPLLNTRNWIRAHLYLGEIDEQKGRKTAACAHYAKVIERWGHATPRSVAADEARAHAAGLACMSTPATPTKPKPSSGSASKSGSIPVE